MPLAAIQTNLLEKLNEALKAVLPIMGIVLLLSFTIAPLPSGILLLFLFGGILLILGMMFSSGIGAVVQILQYVANDESLKMFVIWTMGSLGDVTFNQLAVLIPSIIAGLLLAVITIKPLNLLLFGEEYAVTMGLNVRRSRGLLFLSTTLLAGTVTAFCGPIGFIGLAMPHVTRMLFRNSDHRVLVPGTVLSGASVLLLCDLVSKLFTLPINAITALLGIPIVVWVVLRNKSVTA